MRYVPAALLFLLSGGAGAWGLTLPDGVDLEPIEVYERRLIGEMPEIDGYLGSAPSIEQFNVALDHHLKDRIERLNRDLLEYCSALDREDARLRREASNTPGGWAAYDEIQRIEISAAKEKCNAETKAGEYWALYDHAFALYQARMKEYQFNQSRCLTVGSCGRRKAETARS